MPSAQLFRPFGLLVVSPLLSALLIGCAARPRAAADADGGAAYPPEPRREFRAAWVATVSNIDWPTKPGLDAAAQQREMFAILDRATELKLNAIILQVRTSADALYPSRHEPWSEFLSGVQGKPPQPPYDPLKMWVTEAHRRGIELHAWFNPFRAKMSGAKGERATNHVSRLNPKIVKEYGPYLWLDPSQEAAQRQTVNVMLDVVRRYDVDGIHIDDYFYPYPIKDKEFPDDESWQRYQKSGGKLSRGDWRRENINRLIRRIYVAIKDQRRAVKFGISPFGIWKPGHPEVVQGFNQYEGLFADAKLWLNKGWCDYYTPQLYWKADAPQQPYGPLLAWWVGENWKGRHVWPGLFTSRINATAKSWEPKDILDQIAITRDTPGATGEVHFSMIALTQNRRGISEALAGGPYAEHALVPASRWLDKKAPPRPGFRVREASGDGSGGATVTWRPGWGEKPWQWAVYAQHGAEWKLHVFPAGVRSATLEPDPNLGAVTGVTVRAVDRSGNQSAPGPVRQLAPGVAAPGHVVAVRD